MLGLPCFTHSCGSTFYLILRDRACVWLKARIARSLVLDHSCVDRVVSIRNGDLANLLGPRNLRVLFTRNCIQVFEYKAPS